MGLITDYYDKEKECEYRFSKDGPFWHLCTPGEGQESIFLTEQEFGYALTAMGMALSKSKNLRIYAYAIMNNHIHVIMSGDEIECELFFEKFAKLVKGHLARQGRKISFINFLKKELIAISDLRMLRNEIVYVHRNGFVEGICSTPYSYPWGSGRYFYTLCPQDGVRFSKLTVREKRKITHKAEIKLPEHFCVIKDHLNPESFCEFRKAESFFYDGQQYFAMLGKNLEAFSEIAKRLGDKLIMTDSEIYPLVCTICKREYDVKTPSMLAPEEKLSIARQLHDRYHASNKQISRVLSLKLEIINQLYPKNTAKERK